MNIHNVNHILVNLIAHHTHCTPHTLRGSGISALTTAAIFELTPNAGCVSDKNPQQNIPGLINVMFLLTSLYSNICFVRGNVYFPASLMSLNLFKIRIRQLSADPPLNSLLGEGIARRGITESEL